MPNPISKFSSGLAILLLSGCCNTRIDALEYKVDSQIIDIEYKMRINRLEQAISDSLITPKEAQWIKRMYRESARMKKLGL